jgi:hypothetical protein
MPRSSLAVRNTVERKRKDVKCIRTPSKASLICQPNDPVQKKPKMHRKRRRRKSNTPERSNCSGMQHPLARARPGVVTEHLFGRVFFRYSALVAAYANKNTDKGAGVRRRKSRKRCHHHTQRTITRLGLPAAPLTAWSTSVPGCSGTLQTFSCNLAHRCARPHRRCQHPPTPLGVEAARANVVIANIIPVRPCQ